VDVYVSVAGTGDIVGQIYRQLRATILDGRLTPGQALPPTRELAVGLNVSRNSVLAAYSRLSEEGFIVSRVGAGTFVSSEVGLIGSGRRRGADHTVLCPKAFWGRLPDLAFTQDTAVRYDFRTDLPDTALFPFPTWRRLMMQELRASNRRIGQYGDPAGHAALRAAISRHVGVTRGIHSASDNVTVTAGGQQALDLIARVFLKPGDCVAVEEPGYPPARLTFESYGATITTVKVDAEGLDVSALPSRAKLVFVTPSHQYPTGVSMSLARRHALVSWAERNDAIIIEDECDSEYRYEERPVAALQSLDRSGRVLYVGSFSKVMLPSIRLGYIVAPSLLSGSIGRAKFVADGHCPVTTQTALASFIDSGLLAAHVRRMRQEYRQRREVILCALRQDFASWLTPVPSVAGIHVTARCISLDVDTVHLVRKRATAAAVAISCLSDFYHDQPAKSGLLFGFGSIPANTLREGLSRLRECFMGV